MSRLTQRLFSRSVVMAAALLIALGLLVVEIRRNVASRLPLQDFVQYWSASTLNARGANPYDGSAILAVERSLGWLEPEANFMYNPPWMISVASPFLLLDYTTARSACMLLQFAIIAGVAIVLWDDHGGPVHLRWVAGLLALSAYPSLIAIRLGQSSLLVLLALVGFIHWEGKGRDFLAGAALALAMVKPHLVYLVWPAVGIWAIARRRWGVVAGGVVMLGLLTVVAVVPNPEVFRQFFTMLRDRPPAHFLSPTPGSYLRLIFGGERFWLQYVPPLVGLAWLAGSWRSWLGTCEESWKDRIVPVLFASLLTTSYGAWTPDMVVLLIPVLGLSATLASDGRPRVIAPALVSWMAIDGGAWISGIIRVEEGYFIWLTPTTLVAYALVQRIRKDETR
jgi:hypothetical protein